jgi:hypothetical protein
VDMGRRGSAPPRGKCGKRGSSWEASGRVRPRAGRSAAAKRAALLRDGGASLLPRHFGARASWPRDAFSSAEGHGDRGASSTGRELMRGSTGVRVGERARLAGACVAVSRGRRRTGATRPPTGHRGFLVPRVCIDVDFGGAQRIRRSTAEAARFFGLPEPEHLRRDNPLSRGAMVKRRARSLGLRGARAASIRRRWAACQDLHNYNVQLGQSILGRVAVASTGCAATRPRPCPAADWSNRLRISGTRSYNSARRIGGAPHSGARSHADSHRIICSFQGLPRSSRSVGVLPGRAGADARPGERTTLRPDATTHDPAKRFARANPVPGTPRGPCAGRPRPQIHRSQRSDHAPYARRAVEATAAPSPTDRHACSITRRGRWLLAPLQ